MRLKVAQHEAKEDAARAQARPQPSPAAHNAGLQSRAASLLNLQRRHGNLFVQRLLNGTAIQRKCACDGSSGPTGECAACSNKRLALQRRSADQSKTATVPPLVREVLRSSGQPLDAETRAFMEPRFGHDFGPVRVHTDVRAAESARMMNALAYTVGGSIVFGAGQYAPRTVAGRRLLAHELTHVVQQSQVMKPSIQAIGIEAIEDASEREAEHTAISVMRGLPVTTSNAYSGIRLGFQFDETHSRSTALAAKRGGQNDSSGSKQDKPIRPAACDIQYPCPNIKPVHEAFKKAAHWLPEAKYKIEAYISNPSDQSNKNTADALKTHFAWTEDDGPLDIPGKVAGVIERLFINISKPFFADCPKTPSEEKGQDNKILAAASPIGWNRTNCYQFTKAFFTMSKVQQARAIIHEMMHSWEDMGDPSYEGRGGYPINPNSASSNADSYAALIRDLAESKAKSRKKLPVESKRRR